jgi:hypothetical protein
MSRHFGEGEVCFGAHADAVRAVRASLGQWFELFDEVVLSSSQIVGKPLRIDVLAVPKEEFGYLIGIEVKRGFYRMSEYSLAIKQAADYRLSTINDPRLPTLAGRRVAAGIVFPRWQGGHDKAREYCEPARGMEILAHHFRVGAADYDEGAITFVMNDQRLWSSGEWSGNAPGILGGKERVGSLRMTDPARGWGRRDSH